MTSGQTAAEQEWIATRAAIRANIQKGDTTMTEEEVEKWLAIRKEAGLHIEPETAEIEWIYALTIDPYGVNPGVPEEYQQVGREYFARSPGSDIWVDFGDLPEATRDALWEKHKRKLAFPAGLEELFRNGKGKPRG